MLLQPINWKYFDNCAYNYFLLYEDGIILIWSCTRLLKNKTDMHLFGLCECCAFVMDKLFCIFV